MPVEFNEYTVFPLPTKASVIETYQIVQPTIPPNREEIYFSGPLTSGGAKRLYSPPYAEVIREIIQHNANFAEETVKWIKGSLPEYRKTLPHRIGTKIGWGESEYNRFWLYYLSGIEFGAAEHFEALSVENISRSIFNDHSLDRESRLTQYRRLLDQFHTFTQRSNCTMNPINGVVFLPDHFQSLGCSLERELTSVLETPSEELCFNIHHQGFEEEVLPIAPWLKEDHPDIARHLVQDEVENLIILRQL